MSRELDAMQFVLDLLTDGIITSAVQQIGHTPHDRITEDELPFVQVYSPIDENQEQTKRQPPGTLTIQLDILDVFGNSNVLRDAITALDDTFRIDNTFQGLVENAFITLRSVAERKNDERSVVGAVITVQIAEGLPEPNRISLLDFSDSTKFSIDASGLIENSTYVRGTVGIRKAASGATTTLSASAATFQSGFPLDLSNVKRLRFLNYVNPENSVQALFNMRLRLTNSSGTQSSEYKTTDLPGSGWHFSAYDLTDPVAELGGGVDLSAIERVDFDYLWAFFFAFVSQTYGLIAAELSYTTRDTGDNNGRGYDPGF
jgi:hypothetical protein